MEDQRCSLPDLEDVAGLLPDAQEDFFSLIHRVQSRRMDEQRASVLMSPTEDNNDNHSSISSGRHHHHHHWWAPRSGGTEAVYNFCVSNNTIWFFLWCNNRIQWNQGLNVSADAWKQWFRVLLWSINCRVLLLIVILSFFIHVDEIISY